jgi:hypothetical protein
MGLRFENVRFSKIRRKKTKPGAGMRKALGTSSHHGLQHMKKSHDSVNKISGNSLLKKFRRPIA